MKYPPDPPEECRYCGSNVKLVDDKELYGKSYGGELYLCQNGGCQARVGCHPDGSPLGILANRELRRWRSVAHEAFDPLYEAYDRDLSRDGAGYYIQQAIGVPEEKTHIAMLDLGECKNLIFWLMKEGPTL